MNNSKSEVVDDHNMALFSQMYNNSTGVVYAQLETTAHHQASSGEKKVRRRRKKSKGSVDGGGETALRKRKLTEGQVNMLELNFGNEHKLESERKDRLAAELGLDPRQVAVWFQNRRARWKTKKLDEEYSKLKAAHDSLVLRNCQLESQVIKFEERLAVAENEAKRSSEGTTSSNSPMSSCLSMEAMDAPFMGGFGMIEDPGLQNVFYMPEDNNYVPGYIEWANLYM
ncbi:hypothetical protein QQ045_019194 [Rhodiola kirilowii]